MPHPVGANAGRPKACKCKCYSNINLCSLLFARILLNRPHNRDVQLGNFLSISISTNSLGLLSISTFINSTQADSYQYQLNLSCSNQLINSISTFIPKLLSSLKNLYFKLFCKEIVMLSLSSEY